MTKEILELIEEMDVNGAQLQMALRCAPVIAGIKTSNLLIVLNMHVQYVQNLVKNTAVSCFTLTKKGQKTVLLLYRRRMLEEHLEHTKVRDLLKAAGYRTFVFGKMLEEFSLRYAGYIETGREFPHEMGLFLGYPPEDVEGFIKNRGKNFIASGCWKVYEDAPEKIRLFQFFDRAQELIVRLLAQGACMEELLEAVSDA